MSDKIFVIGHKSPDLDSVAAAMAYAKYKNIISNSDIYRPAVAGEINRETKHALEKFKLETPVLLSSAKDKVVVLVDHNEFAQAVDGIDQAKIMAILDHHKLDFKYSEPIEVLIKPWGSSCSIIYQMFVDAKLELDKNLAGLMLSAALVDTVITKSPTCTDKDREIISHLATIAQIQDWQEYGMELFKIRSSVSELSAAEIIKSDFKDFNLKQGKFGIGQVETVDLSGIEPRENELLEAMDDLKKADSYHSVILFLTDIINEGSKFLVVSDDQPGFEKAMGAKLENGRVYIDGIISRKKQVAPKLTDVFDN